MCNVNFLTEISEANVFSKYVKMRHRVQTLVHTSFRIYILDIGFLCIASYCQCRGVSIGSEQSLFHAIPLLLFLNLPRTCMCRGQLLWSMVYGLCHLNMLCPRHGNLVAAYVFGGVKIRSSYSSSNFYSQSSEHV